MIKITNIVFAGKTTCYDSTINLKNFELNTYFFQDYKIEKMVKIKGKDKYLCSSPNG